MRNDFEWKKQVVQVQRKIPHKEQASGAKPLKEHSNFFFLHSFVFSKPKYVERIFF